MRRMFFYVTHEFIIKINQVMRNEKLGKFFNINENYYCYIRFYKSIAIIP